jgi:predicted XRE-type DNA-binding protein
MNNIEIREAIKKNRLYNYEVAAALGVSEFTLSRKLRNELGQEEKEKLLEVIEKVAKGWRHDWN